MGAPKGNRFWEARSSHGRKPIFANSDQLWEACLQYFEWTEGNPLYEAKAFSFKGDSWIEELPKMRVMTLTGLCLFLDITLDSWNNYRNKDDFLGVCASAEATIREQKFAGASAGLLNPMIIARDLGLKEATASEITGANGSSLIVQIVKLGTDANNPTTE